MGLKTLGTFINICCAQTFQQIFFGLKLCLINNWIFLDLVWSTQAVSLEPYLFIQHLQLLVSYIFRVTTDMSLEPYLFIQHLQLFLSYIFRNTRGIGPWNHGSGKGNPLKRDGCIDVTRLISSSKTKMYNVYIIHIYRNVCLFVRPFSFH